MRVWKGGPEMSAYEDVLLLGGYPNAGIVSRNIPGFVLGSNRKDGHSRRFVGLHEAHKVACKRREGRRQQRATNHGPGGFHPSGGAPGAGDDFELGIDGERFAEDRDNVCAITIDGETHQFAIGIPPWHVVLTVGCHCKSAWTNWL